MRTRNAVLNFNTVNYLQTNKSGMSYYFEGERAEFLPKLSAAKNAFLGISRDLEKYAILQEEGTARNLDKLNLENSIYSKRKAGD